MSIVPPPSDKQRTSRMMTLLGLIAVCAILYFAREVLIPIALATLLSFLLSPLVLWLERHGIKRAIAVIATVVLLIGFVSGLGYLLAGQFVEFVDNLPNYRTNIVQKIHAVKPDKGSVFKRAEAAFNDISKEVETETTSTATGTTATTIQADTVTATLKSSTTGESSGATSADGEHQPAEPEARGSDVASVAELAQRNRDDLLNSTGTRLLARMGGADQQNLQAAVPVRVLEGPPTPFQTFMNMISPLLAIIGNAGLVILILIFFLLEREDLRDRVLRLAGQNQVRVTTEALEEAAARVSRYLLMQLIVNVTYGIPVAIGLWFIGVPNALLWGAMATILRFIPYVGPWIAASMPVALSLAVFNNWTMPLLTISLFIVLELLSNNLMEPILYGHSTGLSPVAIIVSAVFWTWIWGPVGLVLATPITVCLVVLGGYIPQLGFLRVMLGDEQVLDDDARIYNRLLSGATDEAVDIAEEYLEKNGMPDLYDKVLVLALQRAETDRHDELLTQERYDKFLNGMNDLLESVKDKQAQLVAQKAAAESEAAADKKTEDSSDLQDTGSSAESHQIKPGLPSKRIICIPVSDPADETAADMLAQLVAGRDCSIKVLRAGTLASEVVGAVRDFEADVILLSSVPPFAVAHARYLAKRLAIEFPEQKLIAGFWVGDSQVDRADRRLRQVGVDQIYTKLSEAARFL